MAGNRPGTRVLRESAPSRVVNRTPSQTSSNREKRPSGQEMEGAQFILANFAEAKPPPKTEKEGRVNGLSRLKSIGQKFDSVCGLLSMRSAKIRMIQMDGSNYSTQKLDTKTRSTALDAHRTQPPDGSVADEDCAP